MSALDLLARIYSRPPLSWTVRLIDFLARPFARLERAHDERRARQLDELAARLEGVASLRPAASRLRMAAAERRARWSQQ